jgi:hypothetical protein
LRTERICRWVRSLTSSAGIRLRMLCHCGQRLRRPDDQMVKRRIDNRMWSAALALAGQESENAGQECRDCRSAPVSWMIPLSRGACKVVGCLRRAGRGSILGRSEAGMPRPERLLERVVEHRHTDGEERLDGVAVPAFAVGSSVPAQCAHGHCRPARESVLPHLWGSSSLSLQGRHCTKQGILQGDLQSVAVRLEQGCFDPSSIGIRCAGTSARIDGRHTSFVARAVEQAAAVAA